MWPSSGAQRPQRSLTSVDLPAPFWPTRTWTSPRRMARSTRSSASTPGNRLVVPWNSMMSGGEALPSAPTSVFRAWSRWRRARTAPPPPHRRLAEIGHGDELDRSLDPALQFIALLDAEPGLDAVRCHLRTELVDGGEHLAVLHQLLHRRDIVEPDHQHLARAPRGVEGLDHAQRHRVVGRHDALDVRVLGEKVGHQRVGLLGLPVGGARRQHLEPGLLGGLVEAGLAHLRVVGAGVALEDEDLPALAQLLGQLLPGAVGT